MKIRNSLEDILASRTQAIEEFINNNPGTSAATTLTNINYIMKDIEALSREPQDRHRKQLSLGNRWMKICFNFKHFTKIVPH